MKTVFSYTKPYSFLIGVALFLMLLELVVELLQPLVIASIIDDGIVAGDQDTIIRLGLVLMGLSLIGFCQELSIRISLPMHPTAFRLTSGGQSMSVFSRSRLRCSISFRHQASLHG